MVRGAVLLSVLALLSLAACKPKPGASCSGARRVCDGAQEIVCDADTYKAFRCGGPKGCAPDGDAIRCDMSGNAPGDPCPFGDDQTRFCAADGKHELTCDKGKLVARACDRCVVGDPPVCEVAEPANGAPCDPSGAPRCSADGSRLATCEGVTWARLECAGEKRCGEQALGLSCDLTAANVGAACLTAGQKTCAKDGRSTLACEGHAWKQATACVGAERCAFENTNFSCERGRCLVLPIEPACAPPPPEEVTE